MKLLGFVGLLCLSVMLDVAVAKMNVRFAWRQLSFAWPSNQAKLEAIRTGQYKRDANMPLGLDRWNNKLFVTVPRWEDGVAATLSYIDLTTTKTSPELHPYPAWRNHKLPANAAAGLPDKSTIVSVFRVKVDACDRLWMVDTGLSDINGKAQQIAPNAIVIFDLKTDKLVRRFDIPKTQMLDASFLANIVVDSNAGECNNAYAYVPDLGGYGLIVYSFRENHSYRVTHNFFHFDPMRGNFNVGGVNFQWTDGIFTLTPGPRKRDNSRDIYFHALASSREFKVSNRVLQNETFVNTPAAYNSFKYVGTRGLKGQSTAEVYDKRTGVIFYTLVNDDAVGCWNIKRPYTPRTQGLIARDARRLVFPNDLKVDKQGTVWVLSDKMPQFLYANAKMNKTAVNYRILNGNDRELIRGTPCQLPATA